MTEDAERQQRMALGKVVEMIEGIGTIRLLKMQIKQQRMAKSFITSLKILTGERKRQHTGVKSKEGELKSERWVEHFSEVLNSQDPLHPISEENVDLAKIIDEIELGKWTVVEVKRALKKTQNRKSAGIDSLTSELIKADTDLTAEKMTEIFNSLWEEEKMAGERE
ncbi:unnamed protein product [Mytilus coruscus]|uniref:Reverse transcriptase domain-containing protein n=1 Tax=Mytilus coruscus TaxID=42192 RepID=A0A6J8AEX0_MYTCO|nr:unnamed protein product [Mytilus coruscus]